MKLGAEPKKMAILGGLLAVAAVTFYVEVFSGPSEEPHARRPAVTTAQTAVPAATADRPSTSATSRRMRSASLGEFKPVLRPPNPKDRPDPSTIDPQIRFDLLAKLEKVAVESTGRNIFQMGAAPPPQKPNTPLPRSTPTIVINNPPAGAPPVTAQPAPQAPPITFRYYGFEVSKTNGRKQAFLLDGEDIMIAGENDSVKHGRYKIRRIGVNSITIEDTQFKHEQTLPLEEITG